MNQHLSRRDFLKAGVLSILGTAGGVALSQFTKPAKAGSLHNGHSHAMAMATGEVDHVQNGFNPTQIMTDFDYGATSTLPDGRTLREYTIAATEKDIEIAPGIHFPAWTYNGRIPGPTLRCVEGDLIRVHFQNLSSHPHSMHFHGVHPAEMDGVPGSPGMVDSGGDFTYEFEAEPFGVHLYHCHAAPLARHIAKGLYGAFIIDPKQARPAADKEFVMVMSGFDVDFDDQNDFYAINAIPFHYQLHPIEIRAGELVRIYLVNILEFDLLNSFHLHANFFNYYPTGTSLTPGEYTDTIMQTQGQRGIIEFTYKYPGNYMFHAHNTEFAELGWTGNFQVST